MLLKSICLAISGLMFTAPTWAAGIDCARSGSPAEVAICGDASLRALDTQLAGLYAKALRLEPDRRPAILAVQRAWLAERDRCAAEAACLSDIHSRRIAELADGVKHLVAYKPDAVDDRALGELRQAVQDAMKSNPEFALENALKRFTVKSGATSFWNQPQQDGSENRFPTRRPAGVSKNEWRALKRSDVEAGGENGVAGYTLLDLDGDGKRDLIVESYIGGTGLFSHISALPRRGEWFGGRPSHGAVDDDMRDAEADNFLYSLNGRGSNQSAHWVRLQSRVYAAYINGSYGTDDLFLLRPLHVQGLVPSLSVHYRYRFSIPRQQPRQASAGGPYVLDKARHAALLKGLQRVNNAVASEGGDSDKPLCPPPEGVTEDETYAYRNFGPGHYVFEIVGDFPVWFGEECRIGRLINWFGAYGAEGLRAALMVHKPEGAEDEDYEVSIRRRAVKIDSGHAEFDSTF